MHDVISTSIHLDMGGPLLVACLLACIATAVRASSTGAPAAACARIYPEGHNGTSEDLQSSPFVLDISPLYNQLGNIYYTPGYTYTRKGICVYVRTCMHVCRMYNDKIPTHLKLDHRRGGIKL